MEPKVNALPIRFLDVARDEARRFPRDKRDHPGWLAGLPMAVKDYNDVAGQLTTNGSPIYADNRAVADDRTVATLRGNGAIPLAKSNVPEFAGSHTFNPVWGITRNPWNLGRTAGGSSGGAAAALAAGEVWLANGSCLGGSLRIPASFCGVVGLRPSPGLVPRGDGLPAFDSLWVDGPMARTVADLALMLDAMAEAQMKVVERKFTVAEAKAALSEHIVADADLVDAGAIFGTGFAPFRGGPLHYAETLGSNAA